MGLRKAPGVWHESTERGWLFKHKVELFWFNRRSYYEHSGKSAREVFSQHLAGPALVGTDGGRNLWWVGSDFYWDDEWHSAEEIGLLVWERERKRTSKIDRLRRQREADGDPAIEHRRRRPLIPSDVRMFVWARDGGACVICGSREDLEFDHIIPVSKGGSSYQDNIQLLCQPCNREKGTSIE